MEKWVILNEPYINYAVSNKGNVKNIKRNSEIKQFVKHNGYKQVSLWANGKGKSFVVHKLVALYFIDNVYEKPYVNHIDGNKLNNNVNNLEWTTPPENNLHTAANHLAKSKPIKIIDLDNNKIYLFDSISQGARFINKDVRLVSRALKRKNGILHGYKIVRI